MIEDHLDYHQKVVPTLNGYALQTSSRHWRDDSPTYEMIEYGIAKVVQYDEVNELYQEWKKHERDVDEEIK